MLIPSETFVFAEESSVPAAVYLWDDQVNLLQPVQQGCVEVVLETQYEVAAPIDRFLFTPPQSLLPISWETLWGMA